MRYFGKLFVLGLVVSTCLGFARAETGVAPKIYAEMGPGVAKLEFEGLLFNGEPEKWTGSAFLVSPDGLLLTSGHTLPNPANYKKMRFFARLGSKGAPTVDVDPQPVWRSKKNDVAIMRLQISGGTALPLQLTAPMPGVDIVALGFPVTLDLSITKGVVSASDGDTYTMDAAINPGNSGGPVLGMNGKVIGVAEGAHLAWKVNSTEIPLEGIKIFIPVSAFADELPLDIRNANAGLPVLNSSSLPSLIRRSFNVDVTKDDHPVVFAEHSRDYDLPFAAEPGYRITNATLVPYSDTRVSHLMYPISRDGKSVTVHFQLTSGPAVDRYRGWLHATLELTETLDQ